MGSAAAEASGKKERRVRPINHIAISEQTPTATQPVASLLLALRVSEKARARERKREGRALYWADLPRIYHTAFVSYPIHVQPPIPPAVGRIKLFLYNLRHVLFASCKLMHVFIH